MDISVIFVVLGAHFSMPFGIFRYVEPTIRPRYGGCDVWASAISYNRSDLCWVAITGSWLYVIVSCFAPWLSGVFAKRLPLR